MKISILTPTYNRANLLDKLYASILINSNNCSECEVEWLIMDDGSTDNTRRIVEEYVKERIIDIQYFYSQIEAIQQQDLTVSLKQEFIMLNMAINIIATAGKKAIIEN